MANINHFVCPTCGLDFTAGAAYATCDGCGTFFYANQSRNCNPNSNQLPSGPQHEQHTGTALPSGTRKLITG